MRLRRVRAMEPQMNADERRCGFAGMVAGALALFLSFAAPAADVTEPIPVPKLTGRVVDLTGTLTREERDSLSARLKAFEDARGSQVAVLMVPSIGPETIEEFAGRVTDEWKLGRKGVDDGALFVIAKQERKMRIHTGRGVQGTLTDALSKRIVADIVAPKFRTGDFAGGIIAGTDAIMKAIEGEQLPLPEPKKRKVATSSGSVENFFWLAIFLVPVVASMLTKLLGRFFGSTLAGGVTGLAAWVIFGSAIIAGVVAVVALIFAFASGGKSFLSGGRGWGGGGWSSGGGSSGGGGSFSGGGGSFDGGGSSGDW
jgi:uncharacterized protein